MAEQQKHEQGLRNEQQSYVAQQTPVPMALIFLLQIALVTDHRFCLLPKYEYVTLVPVNPLQLC